MFESVKNKLTNFYTNTKDYLSRSNPQYSTRRVSVWGNTRYPVEIRDGSTSQVVERFHSIDLGMDTNLQVLGKRAAVNKKCKNVTNKAISFTALAGAFWYFAQPYASAAYQFSAEACNSVLSSLENMTLEDLQQLISDHSVELIAGGTILSAAALAVVMRKVARCISNTPCCARRRNAPLPLPLHAPIGQGIAPQPQPANRQGNDNARSAQNVQATAANDQANGQRNENALPPQPLNGPDRNVDRLPEADRRNVGWCSKKLKSLKDRTVSATNKVLTPVQTAYTGLKNRADSTVQSAYTGVKNRVLTPVQTAYTGLKNKAASTAQAAAAGIKNRVVSGKNRAISAADAACTKLVDGTRRALWWSTKKAITTPFKVTSFTLRRIAVPAVKLTASVGLRSAKKGVSLTRAAAPKAKRAVGVVAQGVKNYSPQIVQTAFETTGKVAGLIASCISGFSDGIAQLSKENPKLMGSIVAGTLFFGALQHMQGAPELEAAY